jgi:acyl-CoA dehydrogenase
VTRDRVRAELARLVLPAAEEWERERRIPAAAWRALGDAGLLAPADPAAAAVLLEELGRTGYAGVRAAVGVHAVMATTYLEMLGTPAQRRDWLEPARRGELVAALAISEADAGTDLSRLATRAEPVDGGFVVTGEKHYVSNGSQAGFFVTLVRTRDSTAGRGLAGVSLLVVPAGRPGVTRSPQPMLGWRSADVCRVSFDAVEVPAGALLGRPDRALLHLLPALDRERLAAGLLAVGGAGFCLDLLDRLVRDTPGLAAHQVVRHRLADLAAEHELVRTYAYAAVDRQRRGELDTRTASILKLRATELAAEAGRAVLQLSGARGQLADSVADRLYRDAAAGTVAAGPSELMRDLIYESG